MISKKHLRLTLPFIIYLLLVSCRTIENYTDPAAPKFEGHYASDQSDFDGEIKVISWNIKFAAEIDTAIAELKEVEALHGADIILLQEMDQGGVEKISRSLHYNYVYYPASIHTHHDKNFGNAILSKWPVSQPQKILLPHQNPKNNQRRIAVRAVITVGDVQLLTYSVHTETFWLSPPKRNDQIDHLIQDIGQDSPYIVVGGDFNTLTAESITDFEKRFKSVGLERASAKVGYTFAPGNLKFAVDHIFTKGVSTLETGVWRETEASDHFPVWVKLSINSLHGYSRSHWLDYDYAPIYLRFVQ